MLVACPLKKHVMIKHVRSANVSYFFEGVSQLGGANMPQGIFLIFLKGWGLYYP